MNNIKNQLFKNIDKNFIFVLFLFILATIYSISFNQKIKLSGDERHYFQLFLELKTALVEGSFSDYLFGESIKDGFFVPGISFLLLSISTVLELFGLESISSNQDARFYLTIINSVFTFVVFCLCTKLTKKKPIIILLLFIIPYFTFYIGALWGEVVATNLIVIAILLFELNLKTKRNTSSVVLAIIIGLIGSWAALTRPQYALLLVVFIIRGLIILNYEKFDKNVLLKLAIPSLIMISTITLWNSAIDKKYGSFFMVVSSSEHQFLLDEDYVATAKETIDTKSPWQGVHKYLILKSVEHNLSLKKTIDIEKKKLRKRSFYEKVAYQNKMLKNFYLDENHFLNRFNKIGNSKFLRDNFSLLTRVNTILSYLIIFIGWIIFVLPFKNNIMISMYYKILFFLLTLQPVIYRAHGRYYIGLLVIIVFFLGLIKFRNEFDFKKYKYFDILKTGHIISVLYAAGYFLLAISGFFM